MEMMLTMCFSIKSSIKANGTIDFRVDLILTFYDIFGGGKLSKLFFYLYGFPFKISIFSMIMLIMLTLISGWVSGFFELVSGEESLNRIEEVFATKSDFVSTTNNKDKNNNKYQYR